MVSGEGQSTKIESAHTSLAKVEPLPHGESASIEQNTQNVMFIGDRGVGKTTLVVELANPTHPSLRVKVTSHSYEELANDYYATVSSVDEDGQVVNFLQAIATPKEKKRNFNVQVTLSNQVTQSFSVQWLDTPGELLSASPQNSVHRSFEFSEQILRNFKTAKGVIFVLTPHKNLINPERIKALVEPIRDPDRIFPPYNVWVQQFKNYLDALAEHISAQQQVLFCLNMADLFCDTTRIVNEYKLIANDAKFMDIQEKIIHDFFPDLSVYINQYHRKTSGNILNFCITTKYNRSLLELPWTCLANCF